MQDQTTAAELFLDGLRNAHAMETQALSMIQPQLNRLTHYPAVSQALEQHLRETEGQIARLEEILNQMDESASGLKDTMMSMSGSMATMAHATASDEVIKNSFANLAFENFEIAAYTSLITLADLSGNTAARPLLESNLREERQMAAMIEEMIPEVTRQFVSRSASGERADV